MDLHATPAPDPGLFGPGSVAWRVHADPSMLIGGMRALLVQALHPLAMAGVDEHSDFRRDPWGRLQRTSEFVLTATYGTTTEAEQMGRAIQRVHDRVRGVDPVTGRTYEASDPDLLLWVHAVLTDSLLAAYRRYAGRLGREEMDRYVAEMVRMGELVGTPRDRMPTTRAELREVLRSYDDLLLVSDRTHDAVAVVLSPPLPLPLRPLWLLPASAAVALLPARTRRLLGLTWSRPADPAARLGVAALAQLLRLALPGPPHLRAAQQRVRAAA